jgi:hypothetical protein
MNLFRLFLSAGLLTSLAPAFATAQGQTLGRFHQCEGKVTENSRVISFKSSVFVDMKAMFTGKEEFDAALVISTQPERGSRKEESVLMSGADAVMSEKDGKKTLQVKHTVKEGRDEVTTVLTIDLKTLGAELRISEGTEDRAVTLTCTGPQ